MANKFDDETKADGADLRDIVSSRDLIVKCKLGKKCVIIPQANSKALAYIAKMKYEIEPSECATRAIVCVALDPDTDDMIFGKLVDNIATDVHEFVEIMEILADGYTYFTSMDATRKTCDRIQSWIHTLGRTSYIWNNLTNKPDYNLELFNRRFYPFIQVKSKAWKQIAAEAGRAEDYPNISNVDKGADSDFSAESKIAQRHNNFMSWPVLEPAKYGNVANHVRCIKIMIMIGMPQDALEVFMRLCITPSHCHIVKSSDVWDLINPLISDIETKNIIMYCVYYAYYILRHESTRMFSQVRRTYRALFNYAELLCQPAAHGMHFERNPFIQQLSGETFMSQATPFYLSTPREINPSNTFERRLFLITGGAISGINLRALGASVTGSILIPCVTKSPLEEKFKGMRINTARRLRNAPASHVGHYVLTDADLDFISYAEYYYPSYDSLNKVDYIKEMVEREKRSKPTIKEYVEKKSAEEDPNCRESDESIDYNKLADIDISVTTDTYDEFRSRAEELYSRVRANCAFRGPVWMVEIETIAAFKFSIYGPGLTRPIDVFRIPYDPAKMVKKFHVPCVKQWYEGTLNATLRDAEDAEDAHFASSASSSARIIHIENSPADANGLYLFDSCVSALKSGVNEGFKWFSCNKNPADVLLKYAERGISVILNEKERNALDAYIKQSTRWRALVYGDEHEPHDVFGIVSVQHKFFHPCGFNLGIRMGLRNDIFPRDDVFYSKRYPVSYPENITDYGCDLTIKTNKDVIPPNLVNIIKFRHRPPRDDTPDAGYSDK